MTATLRQIIQSLRPGAQPIRDFVIVDHGNGPEIERWTHASAQPTAEEIAGADRVAAAAGPPDIVQAILDALVAKGVLAMGDLPAAARAVVEARRR